MDGEDELDDEEDEEEEEEDDLLRVCFRTTTELFILLLELDDEDELESRLVDFLIYLVLKNCLYYFIKLKKVI